jgi:CBS domain-containing protein
LVRDAASHDVISVSATQTVGELRAWLLTRAPESTHQGFPVVDSNGVLLGVITRRDLLDPEHVDETVVRDILARQPAVVFEDNTLREAADHMVAHGVGRVPVVKRENPGEVVGILSRSDLLSAHRHRLDAALVTEQPPIGRAWRKRLERKQHHDGAN